MNLNARSRSITMSPHIKSSVFSRRRALIAATSSVLSAGTIALLGGGRIAHANTASESDIAILNVAVGLEYEGIAAYAIALKSGLLDEATAKVAAKFQDDHKRHNDALIAAIRQLGGEPVTTKAEAEYAEALNVDQLEHQTDVLDLAARLELGATNAYLGVIPSFSDSALAKVAARLAADEASHFAVLNLSLGRPFAPALGFGA
jgi:rubrerythrin